MAVRPAQVQSVQGACLLLDEGLVGGQQAGERAGVERAQGASAAQLRLRLRRRGRPLRLRLGHTHLLTCRQPHIRAQAFRCCSQLSPHAEKQTPGLQEQKMLGNGNAVQPAAMIRGNSVQ